MEGDKFTLNLVEYCEHLEENMKFMMARAAPPIRNFNWSKYLPGMQVLLKRRG